MRTATIRKTGKMLHRMLAAMLGLVLVLTMLPATAVAAVRDLANNSNQQNAAILEELSTLYGEDAEAVYASLARLGFLDRDGTLKTDFSIDLDGQSMTVDEAMALLDDPSTDLGRVAQVDGTPVPLGDLKTMLQIEAELARIQEKYFTGKSFTQSELDALNGIMDQIATEGITANFMPTAVSGFSPLTASLPVADAPADLPLVAAASPSISINYPSSNAGFYSGHSVGHYELDTSALPSGKTYSVSWRFANGLPGFINADAYLSLSYQPTTITFNSGDIIKIDVFWMGPEIDDDTYEGIRNAFTGSVLSVMEFYDAEGFLFNSGGRVSDSLAVPITTNKQNAFGARNWNTSRTSLEFSQLSKSYDPQKGYLQWRLEYAPEPLNLISPEMMDMIHTAQAIYPAGDNARLTVKAPLNATTQGMLDNASRVMVRKTPSIASADGSIRYPSVVMRFNDLPYAYYDESPAGGVAYVPLNARYTPTYKTPLTWEIDFMLPTNYSKSTGLSAIMDYPEFYMTEQSVIVGNPAVNLALIETDTMQFNAFPTLSIADPYENDWRPKVESISVPNGIYATGQYVPIAITFNQPVKAIAGTTVTINDSSVSAADLGILNVTARRHVAMYKVKEIDGASLNISNIRWIGSLLGFSDSDFLDNNVGAGWQFPDVQLKSVLMKEAVTGLSVTPNDIPTTSQQRAVNIKLNLKQDAGDAFATKYADYSNQTTGTGHAPFQAKIIDTATGNVSETVWLQMKEDENTHELWAEATITNGESTVDDDGIMNLNPGAASAGYTVQIIAYEDVQDTTGSRVLLPTKSFTVQPAIFVDGLNIVYPQGDSSSLTLTDSYRPQLGIQFSGNPSYTSGAWTSSDTSVATISNTGQVSLTGLIGSVSFTFTADNGGVTDPDTNHVRAVTSHSYTVEAGGSPALVIPDEANQIITFKGAKTQIRWSSNAHYFNNNDFSFTVQVFAGNFTEAELATKTPIATLPAPKYADSVAMIPSTTLELPEGLLNLLSVGGTPAYTVRVSIPHPVAANAVLAAQSYIIVKPLLLVPRLAMPAAGQYLLDNQQVAIDWSVGNYEPGVTTGELVIKRVSTAGGQDTTTEFCREPIGAASGSYNLVPAGVTGLKDTYMLSLEVTNPGDEASTSDGYPLYVYNNGALSLQVGGQNSPGALTMDNTPKVSGALPTDTFDIMQMRQELALLEYIGINYGDYNWSQLKDGIKWDTSNHDAATINYKQGGLYEDLTLFSMSTYLPQTKMALSGLRNGQATITATHANTGMAAAVDVDVRTLKDKFYLFQLTPALATAITYTDGNGLQKTVSTNSQGSLALYEPDGIASELQLKSVDGNGDVYLGTLLNVNLLSGERDATKLQLYPLNTLKLRQVAKVEVFLKNPNGSPYTGSVTLRGGAYKNGGYCQDAGLLGNIIPDPATNPLQDGKQPQSVSIGSNGKLTVYMDSLQFYSTEKGEDATTQLLPKDDIQYIFEVSDISGKYPILVYDNGNLMLDGVVRSGGNTITLEAYSGAPQAFVSNQMMDYQLSGGRLIDVRYKAMHIGPNSSYLNTKLVTTALGWGSAPDDTGYKLTVTDEYGYVPAAQTSVVIHYPFSTMPVVINTLVLNQDTVTKSGWVAAGKDVGIRLRLERGQAMLMERPSQQRVTDLTNAEKLTESDNVTAMVADLQGNSAFPGVDGKSVKVGNDMMNGFLKVMNLFTGPMSGVSTKMVITPGGDNTEFNAFIWAGYNSLGLDDINYDSNGMILDTSLMESNLSLGPSLKDSADMARGQYDVKKNIGDAKKAQAEGQGTKDVDVTGQLEGFFDAKIKYNFDTKRWDVFVTDGGFTVGLGASFKFVINASQVPLTAEFQVGGAGQVDFKANLLREQQTGLPWKSDIKSNYVNDYLIALRFNLFIYAFGGIGVDYSMVAVKIGPFGKASVDFTAKFLSRNYLDDSSKRTKIGVAFQATGQVGVKFVTRVLFVEYELIIGSVTAGYKGAYLDWRDIDAYWNETWSSMYSTLAATASVTGFAPVSGGAKLQGRDYLGDFARSWAAGSQQQQFSPLALDDPNALGTLQTNAYPFSFPLVSADGQLLLYAYDSDSADVADTRIYASKLAGGAYPQGGEIAAPGGFTGFGDSGHSLAGTGNFAVASWVRQGVALPAKNAGEAMSAAEQGLMMNGTEIVAAVYNGVSWASTRLTDNALPDLAPVVASDGNGRAFVAWRSVYSADDNNLLDFTQQDYIMYSVYDSGSWSAPKRLYSGTSGTVRGITAAMLPNDGTAAVAYALDTANAGNTADYEVGYAIVDAAGEPSASIVVTRDQWLNQNPQLTVAQFNSEPRFVLGWHSMRDGFSDIRLAAFDSEGVLSNTFPDSIKEASGGADVLIDGNFKFTKASAAISDISNLSIVWSEMAVDKDGDPEYGVLRAVKFDTGGAGISSALDVAKLPSHVFVNHYDAYLPGPDGNTVKAVIQGTLYHDIDPDDPNSYDGYTVPATDEGEQDVTIMVPKEESRLYTATEAYANKAQINGIVADFATLSVNSLAPVQFSVFNAGKDNIDSVTVKLDGQDTTFGGLDLRPNEEALLTCWHATGNSIRNLPYELTANFGLAGAADVLSGTVYLDYPELGISKMETISEEQGKRTMRLTLYNSADATLAGGKDRALSLGFYDNPTFETLIDVSCATDGVVVNADKSLTVAGEAALQLADEGSLVLEVTFDVAQYLTSGVEIPEAGIPFYANARIQESKGGVTNTMPEYYSNDNSALVTFESPLARTGEPVSITVEQGLSGGNTVANITLHNNSLNNKASGNLIVSLLDDAGNVLEQQQTYTSSASMITLNGEETKSLGFSFGQSGSRVTAVYGDLVLADGNANLAELRFDGLAARLSDFMQDANGDYSFTAPNTTLESTLVSFVTENPGATVKLNGSPATSGQTVAIPENSSTITVEVTSADGRVVRKYILTVNRGGLVPPTDYSVTDHFGTWTGSGTMSARIDADHGKFVNLTYNGEVVDPQNYIVTQGSTIITLKESYLNGFANGRHVFIAHFSDGRSENIILTVNRASGGGSGGGAGGGGAGDSGGGAGGSGVPSTGDSSGLTLLAVLTAAFALGMLSLFYRKRRRDCAKAEVAFRRALHRRT